MNSKVETNINSRDQPKDIKKIRSLIAKYKNKSSDLTNTSIEAKILKTLAVNKADFRDEKFKLGEIEYLLYLLYLLFLY